MPGWLHDVVKSSHNTDLPVSGCISHFLSGFCSEWGPGWMWEINAHIKHTLIHINGDDNDDKAHPRTCQKPVLTSASCRSAGEWTRSDGLLRQGRWWRRLAAPPKVGCSSPAEAPVQPSGPLAELEIETNKKRTIWGWEMRRMEILQFASPRDDTARRRAQRGQGLWV